jgi:hypothetical protein
MSFSKAEREFFAWVDEQNQSPEGLLVTQTGKRESSSAPRWWSSQPTGDQGLSTAHASEELDRPLWAHARKEERP